MYAAQYGDALARPRGYGWQLPRGDRAFDMARWQAAKAAETARLEGVYRKLLARQRRRAGRGPGTVRRRRTRCAVGDAPRSRARHILIATGAAPVRDMHPRHRSLRHLRRPARPDRAARARGASSAAATSRSSSPVMLARLGVKVSLLYRDRLPLRGFDEDLRTRVGRGAAPTPASSCMPGQAPRACRRRAGRPGGSRCPTAETLRRRRGCSTPPAAAPTPTGSGWRPSAWSPTRTGAVPVDAHVPHHAWRMCWRSAT